MNGWSLLAFVSLVLAAIPCGLFLSNLFVYRPLRRRSRGGPTQGVGYQLSVLIPARNEEATIRAAVESVLANRGVEFEVLVLDDHSTDRTAAIVRELAERDARVRLLAGEPLPPGWCGKQFACHTLARHARHPLLLFLDADVRLAPDALERVAGFARGREAGLVSGVPRQLTGTLLERLLIPLIHFVLLGFLPMIAMRRSMKEKFAAGCGQLFLARRDAYFAAGGHAAVRASLHDGVMLPRAFRRAGFRTDLFDATDVAACRMYRSNAETWRGLGKNATEGLGAPGVLPVMTALLLGGQVLPFVLLAALPWLPAGAAPPAFAAALCAWIPRFIAAGRFRQPLCGALLHPLGIALLLLIQWQARWRQRAGAPRSWKGRAYPVVAAPAGAAVRPALRRAAALMLLCSLTVAGARAQSRVADNFPSSGRVPPAFTLEDQFRRAQTLAFPRGRPVVLVAADQKGAGQITGWLEALKGRYAQRVEYVGVADVAGVPGLLRGRVRAAFKDKYSHPVMLDWSGKTCAALGLMAGVANVIVLDLQGVELGRFTGAAGTAGLERVFAVLDSELDRGGQPSSKIARAEEPPRPGAPDPRDTGVVARHPVSQTTQP